jgi:hypothetical protein
VITRTCATPHGSRPGSPCCDLPVAKIGNSLLIVSNNSVGGSTSEIIKSANTRNLLSPQLSTVRVAGLFHAVIREEKSEFFIIHLKLREKKTSNSRKMNIYSRIKINACVLLKI